MKVFICSLLLLAVVSTLEGKPANIIHAGATGNSGEVRVDPPQAAGGQIGVVDQAAVAGGNSQGQGKQGAVIHSSSSSSSETNINSGVQAGGGATGDADTPDGTDGPDFESVQESLGGFVAQGGVPFGGGGGGAGGKGQGRGGSAKSSTPPPDYVAGPGLIVSEGGSGGAAVAVLCVVGVVGIAAGVGFFIYKRK